MSRQYYFAPVAEVIVLRPEGMICVSGEPDALTGTMQGYEKGNIVDWEVQ